MGRYPLALPRVSSDFGRFAAIGYPTSDQVKAGATGSSVGVHGPHRRLRWLGSFLNVADTTDGCVGVAHDDDMRRIEYPTRRPRSCLKAEAASESRHGDFGSSASATI